MELEKVKVIDLVFADIKVAMDEMGIRNINDLFAKHSGGSR